VFPFIISLIIEQGKENQKDQKHLHVNFRNAATLRRIWHPHRRVFDGPLTSYIQGFNRMLSTNAYQIAKCTAHGGAIWRTEANKGNESDKEMDRIREREHHTKNKKWPLSLNLRISQFGIKLQSRSPSSWLGNNGSRPLQRQSVTTYRCNPNCKLKHQQGDMKMCDTSRQYHNPR